MTLPWAAAGGAGPPGWPAIEPFPPRGCRRGPPPFVRFIGCLLMAVVVLAVAAGVAIGGLIGPFGFWPVALLAAPFLLFVSIRRLGVSRFTPPITHPLHPALPTQATSPPP